MGSLLAVRLEALRGRGDPAWQAASSVLGHHAQSSDTPPVPTGAHVQWTLCPGFPLVAHSPTDSGLRVAMCGI